MRGKESWGKKGKVMKGKEGEWIGKGRKGGKKKGKVEGRGRELHYYYEGNVGEEIKRVKRGGGGGGGRGIERQGKKRV